SWDGTATRTMSQPAAVSSAICWSVALMSVVGVVVIDCTETGASPPTSTLPTRILRDRRRGASTGGGADGIPREMGVPAVMVSSIPQSGSSSAQPDRVDQIGVDEQQGHGDEPDRDGV